MSTTASTYNVIIKRFQDFADAHPLINRFTYGTIQEGDIGKSCTYPWMHVAPSSTNYDEGQRGMAFDILFADLVRDKDDKPENEKEIISDCSQLFEDLLATIENNDLFGDNVILQKPITITPFLNTFTNNLTGVEGTVTLELDYNFDFCSVPVDFNLNIPTSGAGPSGGVLTFDDSLNLSGTSVTLDNDVDTPGNDFYYGTDATGTKGWYTLPPSAGGDMLKSVYDTDVDGVVDSAERIQIVVRNSTGSTLTKGQIVYLSGATGNRPNAVLAQANTQATSSKTIGMVIANISNNADGQIAVNGTLHDIDTSAFSAGDLLWLSATTAGAVVANTPPAEPNYSVFIGYVARSHPNQGRVVLAIQNGYELNDLHGVQVTSEVGGNILVYDSATSLWKNSNVIERNSTDAALRITQLGTGESLRIEDSTNPDSTPFVITNDGRVGIGDPNPSQKLVVSGIIIASTSLITPTLQATTLYPQNDVSLNIRTRDGGTGTTDLIFGTGNPGGTPTTRMTIKSSGNIGIGTTTPNASALLELSSTTRGFLPPRMTNAQRTAIASPAVGLMVYCTDTTEGLYIYKSTGWTFIA